MITKGAVKLETIGRLLASMKKKLDGFTLRKTWEDDLKRENFENFKKNLYNSNNFTDNLQDMLIILIIKAK